MSLRAEGGGGGGSSLFMVGGVGGRGEMGSGGRGRWGGLWGKADRGLGKAGGAVECYKIGGGAAARGR